MTSLRRWVLPVFALVLGLTFTSGAEAKSKSKKSHGKKAVATQKHKKGKSDKHKKVAKNAKKEKKSKKVAQKSGKKNKKVAARLPEKKVASREPAAFEPVNTVTTTSEATPIVNEVDAMFEQQAASSAATESL